MADMSFSIEENIEENIARIIATAGKMCYTKKLNKKENTRGLYYGSII